MGGLPKRSADRREGGQNLMDGDPYENLRALGITLPEPMRPVATYVPYVREGNLLFISGQGPREPDGHFHTGRVGVDVTPDRAYAHARLTGINLLAVMEMAVGDLRKVRRVVKLLGMVNTAPDFYNQPAVINGCSDLMVAVFGEAGRHARSAVGVATLPFNTTVEIEAVVAVTS